MLGDYDQIVPGLYQGSIPTAKQATYYDDFDVIVFCVDPDADWLSSFVPEGKIIRHFHFDDLDDMSVALGKADEVSSMIRNGRRTLVVCASGLNRSGAFVVLVLYKLGWALDQAASKVLSGRSAAFPTGVKYLIGKVKHYLASKH